MARVNAFAESRFLGSAVSELGVTCKSKTPLEARIRIESVNANVKRADFMDLLDTSTIKCENKPSDLAKNLLFLYVLACPPKIESKIGWKVAAARTETSPTIIPDIPTDLTKGIGTRIKVARAVEIVRPEKITVRPAVFKVLEILAFKSSLLASSISFRKR